MLCLLSSECLPKKEIFCMMWLTPAILDGRSWERQSRTATVPASLAWPDKSFPTPFIWFVYPTLIQPEYTEITTSLESVSANDSEQLSHKSRTCPTPSHPSFLRTLASSSCPVSPSLNKRPRLTLSDGPAQVTNTISAPSEACNKKDLKPSGRLDHTSVIAPLDAHSLLMASPPLSSTALPATTANSIPPMSTMTGAPSGGTFFSSRFCACVGVLLLVDDLLSRVGPGKAAAEVADEGGSQTCCSTIENGLVHSLCVPSYCIIDA